MEVRQAPGKRALGTIAPSNLLPVFAHFVQAFAILPDLRTVGLERSPVASQGSRIMRLPVFVQLFARFVTRLAILMKLLPQRMPGIVRRGCRKRQGNGDSDSGREHEKPFHGIDLRECTAQPKRHAGVAGLESRNSLKRTLPKFRKL